MTELLIFLSTFVSVFALGFQSLNVNSGRYLAAIFTSFMIGAGHLCLYRYLPEASLSQNLAYLIGGPFGIVSSMWAHRRVFARVRAE
ncbi:MAG: hypothetical protein DMF06_15030 [Verrucomicrobia bacterium]|nr:MAG: hypothetical protein DMF06_15030 [Verrucomicrobiota bacterium]